MLKKGGADPNRLQRVEMRGIVKRFPGVLANRSISFDVSAGEVHALLGENGAGKSTLMHQLYGLYRPDEGEILVDGNPVQFRSPADAIRAGIGMIHQHFMLVSSMTVAQNVALGQRSDRSPLLDLRGVSRRIRTLSEEYGLRVDPDASVWQLSVGEQQRVEILKALCWGASLIILDEPTAVLTPQEVTDFFAILKRMVSEGHALVFISHKLHEVLEISDRITVLRDGCAMGTRNTSEVSRSELVRMMVGRDLAPIERHQQAPGPVRLAVRDLTANGDRETVVLKGVYLTVRSGEILGLAGVSGNGQRELAECLAGMRGVTGGSIHAGDREITTDTLNERIEAGLAYIPEERMRDGVIREFSVQDNVFLHDHVSAEFRRGIFLDFARMERHAETLVREFSVKTPDLDTPVRNLSGGNIQKLIMARELSRRPGILVAAQPTRGVDVGAAEYIHTQLLAQRDAGIAILLISEDLDEILALADRIAVIYEGRIVGEIRREDADLERIGLMMAGIPAGGGAVPLPEDQG